MPEPVTEVHILNLPGLGPKEDVSDWLDRGGTREELLALADQAEPDEAVDDDPSIDTDPPPAGTAPTTWPEAPGETAYRGLAGRFVALVEPHTEADPVAVLASLLLAVGAAVGPGPHALVGATRHPARDNTVLGGRSSKARKGDSWGPIDRMLRLILSDWVHNNVANGLSTGEGLVWALRDRIEKQEPVREKGRVVGYETVVADAGVEDKRLLVIEPEFARLLRSMGRQGNTLSAVLRQAWDTGDLRIMTKASPIQASGTHVAVMAHITQEELRRELCATEALNGFANRFLWLAVRRSKLLPEPEPLTDAALLPVATEIAGVIAWARGVGQMVRSDGARQLWREVYADLSGERDGLLGAVLARAEAHVLRLSLLYALLDRSAIVEVPHLQAALELRGYAERSAVYLFGEATGNALADTIAAALAEGPLTRTEISQRLGRHVSSEAIEVALRLLERSGQAMVTIEKTNGRPVERWQRRL